MLSDGFGNYIIEEASLCIQPAIKGRVSNFSPSSDLYISL